MCPMHYHLSLVASLNIAQAKSWTSWRSPRPVYLIRCVPCITKTVQSHLFPRWPGKIMDQLKISKTSISDSMCLLHHWRSTVTPFSHVVQARSWAGDFITNTVQSHLPPTLLSRRVHGPARELWDQYSSCVRNSTHMPHASLTQCSHTFFPRCPGEISGWRFYH